ncbi:hypothetical protein WQ57_12150 [Mesobacillus campisalis]|uniref:Uncharacterized protein n=1 Tax=Mesobacillus campisalis TaxID=1408103 RepID=A0A0M2SY71_9BACI|nr:hypothetical protein WQ57_12150 [Mesobacillus campisalis]
MYSIIIGFLLYLTTVIIPEFKFLNSLPIDLSKWLFLLVISSLFFIINIKWWGKILSLILGLGIYVGLVSMLNS